MQLLQSPRPEPELYVESQKDEPILHHMYHFIPQVFPALILFVFFFLQFHNFLLHGRQARTALKQ